MRKTNYSHETMRLTQSVFVIGYQGVVKMSARRRRLRRANEEGGFDCNLVLQGKDLCTVMHKQIELKE